MSKSALLDQIRLLPHDERAELVETILEEMSHEIPPLSDEWKAEIDRRMAEYDADPSTGVPWEVVRARLWAKNP